MGILTISIALRACISRSWRATEASWKGLALVARGDETFGDSVRARSCCNLRSCVRRFTASSCRCFFSSAMRSSSVVILFFCGSRISVCRQNGAKDVGAWLRVRGGCKDDTCQC